MSPNLITTARNLILINLIYKMTKKNDFTQLGISVFLIGLLDCVDGEYARMYDKVTVFGDYYDHISDVTTTIVLFYLLFKYSQSKLNVIIGLIFLFLCLQHYTCIEKYRNKYLNIVTGRDSTHVINNLCPHKSKKSLEKYLDIYRYIIYMYLCN